MRTKAKIALLGTAVFLSAAVIVGALFTANRARCEKNKYIETERRMALLDLCDALIEMDKALADGNTSALNFAAGRAEAYLSRAGFDGAGEAYRMIAMIASGECGADECRALINAAEASLGGDDNAFSSLNSREMREVKFTEETTEDMLASRMLERIGKGRDDVAYSRAVGFACPNALFDEARCDGECFKYSGDNIFIAVGGVNSRVLMYCFEREVDARYSVSEQEALNAAQNVVKREKLRLHGEAHTELRDGIYRNVWYEDESGEPLVILEIYSDTGRLRLYDAVNYYAKLS